MTTELTFEQQLAEQKEETRGIVEALLADGSDPKATYTVEHHFVSEDFDTLEQVAVDCFKAGFEVDDAEELELEDDSIAFCFDAIGEHRLDLDRLDKDCETLMQIAEKNDVLYDGWGTHFIEVE